MKAIKTSKVQEVNIFFHDKQSVRIPVHVVVYLEKEGKRWGDRCS
ncbi:MAG: hypothetical protein QMD82_01650 [bacterium]|nr:hypothetical protein [bacterium]